MKQKRNKNQSKMNQKWNKNERKNFSIKQKRKKYNKIFSINFFSNLVSQGKCNNGKNSIIRIILTM